MTQITPLSRRACSRARRMILLLALLAALAGCTPAEEGLPAPAVDRLTPSPAMTPTPAAASTLPPASPEPTALPTVQIDPTPATASVVLSSDNKSAAVVIREPAAGSRIVSPLQPQIILNLRQGVILRIELLGKGKVIYSRQVMDLNKKLGQDITLTPSLPFEISQPSETARLVVSLLDSFERVIALDSIDLTLSFAGENVRPDSSTTRLLAISSPQENQEISGKKVQIAAEIIPINDEPIVAELIDEDRVVINTKLIDLPEGRLPGQAVQLDFSIPYTVAVPTPCRVTLYQASYNRIQSVLMLSSVPVTLLPEE